MAHNRSLLFLLAAIIGTLIAIVAHPLVPDRELSIVPEPDLDVIFALYGDSVEGGPSHSEWVGPEEDRLWRCRVEEEGTPVYCGMNIILSHDPLKGLDLTAYHAVDLRLHADGHDKKVQFFMRHYDERYSNPDDNNSAQFNKFDFLPGELDGSIHLHFEELNLADWWSRERLLPRELRRPAFHNVIAIGIGYSDAMTPGNYDVKIERISFVGDWISAELWYLSILLFWLAGLMIWALRRLRLLAVKARRQRRSLDLLTNRNESLKEESERYKHLSSRDPLTGAYNRYGFEQRLSELLHSEEFHPLALILLDVDHFKQFNDTYGHDVGDKVLRHLVNLLDRHTRQQDVLCRWGGEEFLLLCPATTVENAACLAEKLRSLIAEEGLKEEDIEISLTASFGVCQLAEGESYVDAFVRADRALYSAKHQGRNRVVPADASQSH
ncbi:GGDEF domain-containing protein [Marinimicrobium agarilyticum]|uniref:GGDEF domain-containing protein n=1 Tax=Marinimicrobium agarilyticum TaxID=306546 RepID=UPI0004120AE2|nr:GGDEF domain-containing protein [Marinimicrobium agarilyticum]